MFFHCKMFHVELGQKLGENHSYSKLMSHIAAASTSSASDLFHYKLQVLGVSDPLR